MVFFLFLTGGLSLLWFIIGLKMKKTDPNNEIEKIYPSYWHLIMVLIYISTLENHRKGWSREIPEPVFSIYLTFLPCIPLNHNPLPRHKRTIRFLRFKFSINH